MSRNCKNYFDDGGDTLIIGGKLVVEEGAEVEGMPGGDSYTLPEATKTRLGGVKVGAGLKVSSGTISLDLTKAANQADSTAETVEALVADFNALLAKLVTAGLMQSGT